MTMGTKQATRAVVDGTKKERINPQRITPRTIRFGSAPTLCSTNRAILLSRPVIVIAAAKKRAAPTRQKAGDEKPASAIFIPAEVPIICSGLAPGEKPIKIAVKVMMRTAETG